MPHLIGSDAATWAARLSGELDNLRAALAFAQGVKDGELLLRLVGALARFWWQQGHLREGRAWLEDAVAASDIPVRSRLLALQGLASLTWTQGDLVATAEHAEATMAFADEIGDISGSVYGRILLAHVAALQGDLDRAWNLYEQIAADARREGLTRLASTAIDGLGNIALRRGNDAHALELFIEAIALDRDLGDPSSLGISVCNAGFAALRLGYLDRACDHIREAVELFRDLPHGLFFALNLSAGLAAALGRPADAALLVGKSNALGDDSGYVLEPLEQATATETIRQVQAALGNATHSKIAEGKEMSLDDAVTLALSVTHGPRGQLNLLTPRQRQPLSP